MDTTPSHNTPGSNITPEPSSQKWWQRYKKQLIIGGAVALLLVATAVAFAVMNTPRQVVEDPQTKNNSESYGSANTSTFLEQYKETCKERDASLTASPIALDKLGYIEPLGKVSDGHVTPTDHQYWAPKDTRAADNTTDVVMPGDGTVVEISAMPSQYIGDRQQQTAAEDHRLVISHSCQYFSIFIHIHKLSDALKSAVGDLAPNTSKRVSVDLKAGDALGKIGGNPVDWTFMDTTKNLSGLITPKLYIGESWKIHTVDPLGVYTGDLKTKLEAASLRSKAPLGGKIDYDVKGALIGNWFREGTNGYSGADQQRYWDGHLSIAPDYIDGTTTIASIGNWDGKAAQYAVKGTFDASTITKAKGVVKLELITRSYVLPNGTNWTGNETPGKGITVSQNATSVGTLLVQVEDGEKLKVERFVGKTPAQVSGFTAAAQMYER